MLELKVAQFFKGCPERRDCSFSSKVMTFKRATKLAVYVEINNLFDADSNGANSLSLTVLNHLKQFSIGNSDSIIHRNN